MEARFEPLQLLRDQTALELMKASACPQTWTAGPCGQKRAGDRAEEDGGCLFITILSNSR